MALMISANYSVLCAVDFCRQSMDWFTVTPGSLSSAACLHKFVFPLLCFRKCCAETDLLSPHYCCTVICGINGLPPELHNLVGQLRYYGLMTAAPTVLLLGLMGALPACLKASKQSKYLPSK